MLNALKSSLNSFIPSLWGFEQIFSLFTVFTFLPAIFVSVFPLLWVCVCVCVCVERRVQSLPAERARTERLLGWQNFSRHVHSLCESPFTKTALYIRRESDSSVTCVCVCLCMSEWVYESKCVCMRVSKCVCLCVCVFQSFSINFKGEFALIQAKLRYSVHCAEDRSFWCVLWAELLLFFHVYLTYFCTGVCLSGSAGVGSTILGLGLFLSTTFRATWGAFSFFNL